MKKIAIFVEGITEQEFVVGLVSALVGSRGIHIILNRQFEGKVQITLSVPAENIDFYVLIVDCANDEQVKTQVREQYATLVGEGFTAIIGLRDVHPFSRADISKVQAVLSTGLPVGAVTPQMHLAVMEVEAWFLGEITHFARVRNALTVSFIIGNGFDIEGQLGDSWDHPARILHNIYRLANTGFFGSRGHKTKRRVQRTIQALSFEELYVKVRQQLPALDGFITSVESALF